MPINFPSSPSSGQRYEFSFNAWIWNGTFWQSTGASGNITSGNIGNNAIFSGNIASGQIGQFHLASGVGASSLALTSGSVTSGLIGDNSVRSGNIASGQIGLFHFVSSVDSPIIAYFNNATLIKTLGGTKGFFAGGDTGISNLVATADKLTYSTDITVAQTSANISQARRSLAGSSGEGTKGYFAGGDGVSGLTNTTDIINYYSEITSYNSSSNLSQARITAGIADGSTKGYFAGGTYTVQLTDRILFSNNTTAAQTTANLTQGRVALAGCSGEGNKGYYVGGSTNVFGKVSTADKITYSTDTSNAQTSANLSVNTNYLASVSENKTKGYFAGGMTGTSSNVNVSSAYILIYSTDTTSTKTSANLTQSRRGMNGLSEGSVKSYFGGGYTTTVVTTTDKLTFSNDTTTAQTSANLSQAREPAAASQEYSTVFGNNCINSGNISSGQIGSIHFGFSFPLSGSIKSGNIGDNAVNSGNIASGQITNNHISYFDVGVLEYNLLQGGTKGYFAGGYTNIGNNVNTADKVTYSNDTTAAQTTARLSQARYSLAAVAEILTKGYFAGGLIVGVGYASLTDKLTYSNDTTAAQTSANLTAPKEGHTGITEGITKGYFAGGSTGAIVATTDKIIFSSDTTVAQTSANLTQARSALAGVSGVGIKGYFAGGVTSPGIGQKTAEKLIYSNDTTVAQTTANLSLERYGLGSVSGDGTKGYFGGGYTGGQQTLTDKIIYFTDTTVAQTSANLTQARSVLAGVSGEGTKGYFAGGDSGNSDSTPTTDKITYSNDTTAAQASANLSQARHYLAAIGEPTVRLSTYFDSNCVFSGNVSLSEIGWLHFISGTFSSGGGLNPVFNSGSITSGMFGDNSTLSGNIASGVISRFKLSNQSIFSDAIRSGNLVTFAFSNNAILSGNISNSGSINTTNLASGCIQSGAFGDNAISSGNILSGTITSINLSSGALQSFNISSGSILAAQLASGAAVGAFKLASGIVVSGNIASGVIFRTPFADASILSGAIASGVIGNFHPANSSVTSGAVPSGTVIFNMVGANATVANNFADVALASGNFALQSVTGDNLADGVWQQPTAFYVSGGITAFMFNTNSILSTNMSFTNTNRNIGYFAGGTTGVFGAAVGTVDKINYANDTSTATGQSLSVNRQNAGGTIGSSTKGYICGGEAASMSNRTDAITYTTDISSALTTANITSNRNPTALNGSGSAGYLGGGATTVAGAMVTTTDKLLFSSDTTSSIATAVLSVARAHMGGVSNKSSAGYWFGGTTQGNISLNGEQTTIDKIIFSTDTTSFFSNLSAARAGMSSVSNNSLGWFLGGTTNRSSFTNNGYRIDLSSEAISSTSTNLSSVRAGGGGSSNPSTSVGYVAGGETSSNNHTNVTDKIDLTTGLGSATSTANLSQSRGYVAGIDAGTQPVFSGNIVVTSGKLTTTAANEIRSTNMASGAVLSGSIVSGVVFSNGTTNNLSNAGVRSGNIQSGEVARVHFVNNTILSGNIGSGVINFPTFFGDVTQYVNIGSGQIGNIHLCSLAPTTTNTGYFAGGNSGSTYLTTIQRLNYASESTSTASISLSKGRHSLAGVSSTNYGYFAGGYTTGGVIVADAEKLTYSTETIESKTTANLSQARVLLAGCSGNETNGYFAGGQTGVAIQVNTAEKLTYSTDTTASQTTANLTQARTELGAVTDSSTKGYFAGGNSASGIRVATTDKLTYSTDTTSAQTSANLTAATDRLSGCDGEKTKGYFNGGDGAANTNKIIYASDTTVTQTSANITWATFNSAAISDLSTKGYFAGNNNNIMWRITYSNDTGYQTLSTTLNGSYNLLAGVNGGEAPGSPPIYHLTSSTLSSGTITLVTASGQNAAFPYSLAETAQINTNRPMFDYFLAGELISGIKAVCIGSGNTVRRAERASGLRLPAIGVTSGAILSGTTGRVFYYGYVGQTVSGQVASGFQGQPLYVGSGGFIVNRSGFMGGAASGAPFLSGDMQQQIGIAMSGGLFVMPSPMMIRSGFQGTLPYDMR